MGFRYFKIKTPWHKFYVKTVEAIHLRGEAQNINYCLLMRIILNNDDSEWRSSMLINKFSPAHIKLLDMPSRDARHILAARSWCILRTAAQNPLPRLEIYLLSDIVALRFGLLMETVTQIWPEPFGIHRLCCGLASVDERLLADATRLAAANQRAGFESLLHEMLTGDARQILFARAQGLYA
jgi:hypothetical protein